MKEKKLQKWEQEGFQSKASYLNNKLAEKGITFKDYSKDNRLVCIANISTGEVLRITFTKAIDEFIQPYPNTWYFTNKSVYKRYIDSKLPGKEWLAPKFYKKKEKEEDKTVLINVSVGHPSYRINRKKSSCNKKGKYRYQHIKTNTVNVLDDEGDVIYERDHHARTIKHLTNFKRKRRK